MVENLVSIPVWRRLKYNNNNSFYIFLPFSFFSFLFLPRRLRTVFGDLFSDNVNIPKGIKPQILTYNNTRYVRAYETHTMTLLKNIYVAFFTSPVFAYFSGAYAENVWYYIAFFQFFKENFPKYNCCKLVCWPRFIEAATKFSARW